MHRAASHPPFRPEPVRQMADFVRRNVNARLDPIMDLGEADIVDAMIYEVPAATILHMMGVPDEQMGMIKDFRGPWGVFGWGYPTEEQQIEVARGMGEFGAWARQLSDERRANPGDDLVSGYIQHLLDNDADDPDFIRSYTLNVVMAGHETTTNTTAGGIISLLTHRDQWELLCREPEWCANAADEILRHDTGVPTWRQRAVQDIEVSGVTIPAGAKIYCALVSANRDEEIFGEDAMTFDVTRKNAARHMAFGTGAHTCLGNHLAKLEIKIMLEELTRRLPHMELVPDQEYTFSPNTSQRGPEHVHVQWDPAQNPVD
jgi:cytochrome P450